MNRSLKDILHNVSQISSKGPSNQNVSKIEVDSRKIQKDFLFVALSGLKSDGHDHIEESIINGASSIICKDLPLNLKKQSHIFK